MRCHAYHNTILLQNHLGGRLVILTGAFCAAWLDIPERIRMPLNPVDVRVRNLKKEKQLCSG